MPHPIFEDWKDYETLKGEDEDVNIFCCTEKWEVTYLRKKIKRHFPNLHAKEVIDAITYCCETASPPHPRKAFVAYVMGRFGIKIK
jgi:hypothetical protein